MGRKENWCDEIINILFTFFDNPDLWLGFFILKDFKYKFVANNINRNIAI